MDELLTGDQGLPESVDTVASGDTAPVVQPDDQAQADEQATAPVEVDETSALSPDAKKELDRVLTRMRQKDTERVRELEDKVTKLSWAEQLNQLTSSPDPADRRKAAAMLKSVVNLLDTPEAEPAADPYSQVDWESAEIVAPGISGAFQTLRSQLEAMQQQFGRVGAFTEAQAKAIAYKQVETELADVKKWADENGLPFDARKVLETDNKLGLKNLKASYMTAYADQVLDSAKKSERARLEAKKSATLPAPNGAGGSSRPAFQKTNDIHAIFEQVRKNMT